MKAGTCYDISHYCSNQFSTDVEDRLSNLRHRHHSCFLSNFDCVWSIFVCGYWNKAVFRRVARPASWEGSHRWIAPWMVGGQIYFHLQPATQPVCCSTLFYMQISILYLTRENSKLGEETESLNWNHYWSKGGGEHLPISQTKECRCIFQTNGSFG